MTPSPLLRPTVIGRLKSLLRFGTRWRRPLLWSALVGLLLIAQSALLALTLRYESSRAQEQVEQIAAEASGLIKQAAGAHLQGLETIISPPNGDTQDWSVRALELMRNTAHVFHIERRDLKLTVMDTVDSPFRQPLFNLMPRHKLDVEAELACNAARRQHTSLYSRSYFVPMPAGDGLEVVDVCLLQISGGRHVGYLVATVGLSQMLEGVVSTEHMRGHEFSFVESDGTRLARAGLTRGASFYISKHLVDLPGLTLQLRVDSSLSSPKLIPNLATALVFGLSLALFTVVLMLARDVRRRARVEAALAESLAFRKAMENSVVTGLRARDLNGVVTYVNPAFCAMVGFSAEELLGQDLPPYWPPEYVDTYQQRRKELLQHQYDPQVQREGIETEFMRKNEERFPVLIFEAPLVDPQGRQTGWMSAVLDVSAQRRVEEISRQQQERLQATARLTTMGEMASLLSHELNQPLAAIASYATGSMNLLEHEAQDPQTHDMMHMAMSRIAEQAERAGRIIKSVHDFVRRRDQTRETLAVDQLIDAVMPLVRLQARKSGTRIELDLPQPVPRLRCDRTMMEQVLLNLTRNGIQAMENSTPPADRVLTLRVRQVDRWVHFFVEDRGPGIAPEVAKQLFTPFFTTRSEGMGLGLSLCRTVVEQHGGSLDYEARVDATPAEASGTCFHFTLPTDLPSERPLGRAVASGTALN